LCEKIDAIANEIIGFPRHFSIHSGGFALSADPIVDIAPVEPARMDGCAVIQRDMYDLDTLGNDGLCQKRLVCSKFLRFFL
jgi:DNA polymerase III alpha subunit